MKRKEILNFLNLHLSASSPFPIIWIIIPHMKEYGA